jgi:hypothetical protein
VQARALSPVLRMRRGSGCEACDHRGAGPAVHPAPVSAHGRDARTLPAAPAVTPLGGPASRAFRRGSGGGDVRLIVPGIGALVVAIRRAVTGLDIARLTLRCAMAPALEPTLRAAAIVAVAVAVVALRPTLLLLGGQFALRLGQHAGVVLGVLHEVLGSDAVIGHLGVAREDLILLDDLLRRAAHLALRS